MRGIQIPLPPLAEQKAIVVKLDQAFKAIDQAKANVEKNIANAEELFQSQLNQIFSQTGEGWEERKLDEITEVKDGTHDSPKYVEEGIPFVTQKNIKDGELVLTNTKFISEEDHQKFYKRSDAQFNDILIAMIGANRGNVCMVKTKEVFSIKNVGLIKYSDNFDPKFILYYLRSKASKKYIENNSSGSAQGFIGLTKLRKFPIKFTNISHQKELVKAINLLEQNLNEIKQKYQQKLESLEELRQSILEKAFQGELV